MSQGRRPDQLCSANVGATLALYCTAALVIAGIVLEVLR